MTKNNNKCFSISNICENKDEFECLARIENYSKLCKWITVGENLSSNEFTLYFPNSIGESQWKLLFYPNGQYLNGKAGSHVAIYVHLLSCDNQYKTLTADVLFRIKAPCENQANGHVIRKMMNNEFVYLNPNKRWFGHPKFEQIDVMNSRRFKRFFVNDTLTISCLIKESAVQIDSEDIATAPHPHTNGSNVGVNSQSELFLECGATNVLKESDRKDNPESSTWTVADRKRKNGQQSKRNDNLLSSSINSNSSNQCKRPEKAELNTMPNVKKKKQPYRKCKSAGPRKNKKN